MLAQGLDAATTKTLILGRRQDFGPVHASGVTLKEPAEPVKTDAGCLGLQQRLPHRQARIVRRVVGKAVAIEHGAAAVTVSTDNQPRILAGDMRIQPAQIGIDVVGRTKEEGEDVEKMHRRFMDKEPVHGLEIGLPVEIGVRPTPVSRAQREMKLENPAQPSRRDDVLQRAIPGLEAKILMHDQLGPGRRRQRRHPPRGFQRTAEGLLADDSADPTRQRQLDERGMRIRWRGNIKDIDPVRLKKRYQAFMARNIGRDRGVRVWIRHGDKPRPGGGLPAGVMKLREIAGADTRHGEILRDHIFSYIGRTPSGKAPNAETRPCTELFIPPALRFNMGTIRRTNQQPGHSAMSETLWEVYAVKYADRNNRTRFESFMFDPHHQQPHAMDYFIWVLRSGGHTILVDTGYDAEEAERRGRPILRHPVKALEALELTPDDIDDVIVTHLHYDHAGTLGSFPRARFHVQPAEMAYATGPCMCEDVLRKPFTGDHICEAVKAVFSGRVTFNDADDRVADGITVHRVGGHSKGLQVVRVKTASGWICLASDATHYYENFITRTPFPIVVDVEEMIRGYDRIQTLASRAEMIIPGHDPLVTSLYPSYGTSGFVWRLDGGPTGSLPTSFT